MTEQIDSIELAGEADQLPAVFARAFNSGDSAAVQRLFDPEAVFVPEAGVSISGDELLRGVAGSVDRGIPLTTTPRHIYVAGDIALMIVDWSMQEPGPDGQPVLTEGTSTDVARRGADGKWRYLIDSPAGTALAEPGAP